MIIYQTYADDEWITPKTNFWIIERRSEDLTLLLKLSKNLELVS